MPRAPGEEEWVVLHALKAALVSGGQSCFRRPRLRHSCTFQPATKMAVFGSKGRKHTSMMQFPQLASEATSNRRMSITVSGVKPGEPCQQRRRGSLRSPNTWRVAAQLLHCRSCSGDIFKLCSTGVMRPSVGCMSFAKVGLARAVNLGHSCTFASSVRF